MRTTFAIVVMAVLISANAMAVTCADPLITAGGYGCNWTFNNAASGNAGTGTIFALDSRTTNSGQGCLSFELLAPAGAPFPNPSAKFNVWVDFKTVFGCTCETTGTVASPEPDAGKKLGCVVGAIDFTTPQGSHDPKKNAMLVGKRPPTASDPLTLHAAFDDGTSGLLECVPDPFCKP